MPYLQFTQYYDEVVRGNGYSLETEVSLLNECIQKFGNGGKKIVEFACGTGIIASELIKNGYSVYGVDISETMLALAQKNIGSKNCYLGNMCNINLKKQFDVVLCNYNSICHLTSWKQWQDFFQNSFKHLKTGGILIFDINTVWEFENITRDFAQFYTIGDDTVCLEMEKNNNMYEWIVKMFVKNHVGNFDLHVEKIPEQSFQLKKIIKELEVQGFEHVHSEDFHKGLVDVESERVYLIAKKK